MLVKKNLRLKVGEKICIFSNDILIGLYRISKEKEIFARPEFVLQPLKEPSGSFRKSPQSSER